MNWGYQGSLDTPGIAAKPAGTRVRTTQVQQSTWMVGSRRFYALVLGPVRARIVGPCGQLRPLSEGCRWARPGRRLTPRPVGAHSGLDGRAIDGPYHPCSVKSRHARFPAVVRPAHAASRHGSASKCVLHQQRASHGRRRDARGPDLESRTRRARRRHDPTAGCVSREVTVRMWALRWQGRGALRGPPRRSGVRCCRRALQACKRGVSHDRLRGTGEALRSDSPERLQASLEVVTADGVRSRVDLRVDVACPPAVRASRGCTDGPSARKWSQMLGVHGSSIERVGDEVPPRLDVVAAGTRPELMPAGGALCGFQRSESTYDSTERVHNALRQHVFWCWQIYDGEPTTAGERLAQSIDRPFRHVGQCHVEVCGIRSRERAGGDLGRYLLRV